VKLETKKKLKTLGFILAAAAAATTVILFFWNIPWNLATGLSKKVDTQTLEKELSALRKIDIKTINDGLDSLAKRVQQVKTNVAKIGDALNREIIPRINKAHKEFLIKIKEIELVSRAYHDSLSRTIANLDSRQTDSTFQRAVITRLDSLTNGFALVQERVDALTWVFRRPRGQIAASGIPPIMEDQWILTRAEFNEQMIPVSSRIDSLDIKINLLQKSFEKLLKQLLSEGEDTTMK